MNPKQRVFLNSLSGIGLFLVSLVVAFLLAPVLIHGLGNRDYSIWELVLGFLAYFRILDLGVAPALVRFLAQAVAQEDWRRVRAVHHSAMTGLALAALLSLVGFVLISLRPEPLLNIPPGDLPRASRLFLLTGFALAVQFFGISFSAYLQGIQKHYVVNTIRGVALIVQAVGFYQVATHPGPAPLASLAAVYLGASILEYGTYALLVLLGPDRSPIRPWLASKTILKELYVFGFKSFNLMIADRLRKASLPFVITHITGVSYVVYFSQPSRLMDFAMNFMAYLHQPMMPYFSAVSSQGDTQAIRASWISMSRALQFLVLFMALGIFFLGVPFIDRWLGAEYAREGYWVVKILALGLFVEAVSSTALTLLVSLDQHGKPSVLAITYSVLTILVAIPLVRSYGVTGAAIALATANAVTSLTFLHMACNRVGTHLGSFILHTTLRFIIPLALSGSTFWFLGVQAPPTTYLGILGHASVAAVVYLVSGWTLGLKTDERTALRHFLSRS